jgi:hypothetical protein
VDGNVPGSDRFQNVEVTGNTFSAIGSTAPTKRNLSWSIEADGVTNGVFKNNTFVNLPNFSNLFKLRVVPSCKNLEIDLPKLKLEGDKIIYGAVEPTQPSYLEEDFDRLGLAILLLTNQ